MITPYIPARGDLVWINLNPVAGHEQAGYRPAVVITPRDYNAQTRLAVVCPITRRVKHYRFEVPLPAGLAVTGVVLSDHVRSVDWQSRDATLIGIVPYDVLEELEEHRAPGPRRARRERLATLLGIE